MKGVRLVPTAVPVVALMVDRLAGEPPPSLHPVVWVGRYLDAWTERHQPDGTPAVEVLQGALGVGVGCVLSVAAAWAAGRVLARLPRVVRPIVEGALLSTLLSERMLTREVLATDHALHDGIDAGRRRLAGLVSRDVSALDAGEVREGALESLAENASDSVVASLWWYAVAGLPGAAVYRFVNTADAMWGYRTPAWEWRGKVAARLDDVCNWVPARLTAMLLAPGWHVGRLACEARRTPSPNAGWPIAAVAMRWNVQLRKPGVYTLNETGRRPRSADVADVVAAVRRVSVAAAVAAALVGGRQA